ncbi:hypothetical protein A2U01_0033898 [Trifolium medium]|uniref:Uncharacterized protein n=1 Tax=Trifolium medium TaxID=97028 RepID=A0A392PL31_9FABA|nr:hypothetical protein [Trifolium medium]
MRCHKFVSVENILVETTSLYKLDIAMAHQWDWCFFALPCGTADSSLLEPSGLRAHGGA